MMATASGLLFTKSPEQYGEKFSEHLLEQYKLYVQSAQQISDRRAMANNYMLTLNSTRATLYGVAAAAVGVHRWLAALPAAGLLICLAWYSLIRAYRNLNSTKFHVIQELELYLPAALFGFEEKVGRREESRRYRPFARTERTIPLIFALLYIGLAGYTLWRPTPMSKGQVTDRASSFAENMQVSSWTLLNPGPTLMGDPPRPARRESG